MPPVDDPLARLHGRSAVADMLTDLSAAGTGRGVKGQWPILGGFELDLYMLFEGVQGLGGFTAICRNRQFSLLKQLMHIGPNVNSYGTQLRNRYRSNLLPDEARLREVLEDVYIRHGFHTNTPDFLAPRGVRVPDDGTERHTVVVARGTGVSEAAAIKKPLPEATLAAVRARMNPYFLSADECNHEVFTTAAAGGPRRPSLTQLDVRLHIVREWYRDVTTRLDVYTALKNVPVLYHDLGVEVFTYLELRGIINFGAVAPDPVARNLLSTFLTDRKREVALVGAGLAALAATALLRSYGVSVTLLEARDRPGGRVHTAAAAECSAPVDLGAMVVTGCFQNPLRYVANQLGVPLLPLDAEEARPLFDVDGALVPVPVVADIRFHHRAIMEAAAKFRKESDVDNGELDDMSLGEAHQVALERRAWKRAAQQYLDLEEKGHIHRLGTIETGVAISSKAKMAMEAAEAENDYHSRIYRWFLANLDFSLAADVWDVSLLHWDHSDHGAFEGEHMLVTGGFGKLVDGLVAENKIDASFRYSHAVTEIQTHALEISSTKYVSISCETGPGQTQSGNFDAAIVTMPLGVLKAGAVKFVPPLPAEKQNAICRLGAGGLVKVILEFEMVFWSDQSAFGALRDSVEARGEHYFFWNMHKCTGKPVLISLIAEPSVAKAEAKSDEEMQKEAMLVVRQCYPSAPDPEKVIVTRWSEDKFSRGASSYVAPNCHPSDYSVLAAVTEGSPVYFAGEHTYRRHPGNAGSAFLSGYVAASQVLEDFGMVPQIASVHKHMLMNAIREVTQAPAEAGASFGGMAARGAVTRDSSNRANNARGSSSRTESASAMNPLVHMTGEAVELSNERFHRARTFEQDGP